jgi:diacylglycerol kinase (ATP)
VDGPPTYVVFNPHSGKGRGKAVVSPVLEALRDGGSLEHALTTAPGDEEKLTEDAIRRGFRRIVAVGGDGTWSKVANAILRSGEPADLGLVASGTGCDLAKSLGIPRDVPGAARIVRDGRRRVIDVGRIEERYFLNIVGFGYDVAVLEDSWTVSYLGGELLYLYCALRQLRSFPGFPVEIELDGASQGRREMLMLIVANARVFGGGFRIAPRADLADGRLDAMGFANMGLLRRVGIIGRLLKGTHERAPEVTASTARRVRLRFQAPPAYETDGEWNQARSSDVEVEVVPAALRVLAPPP